MKSQLIKKLHEVGVYRDPKTKQKLECMRVPDILQVLNMVEEEMANGVVYERTQCEYEFVAPPKKKEKSMGKKKK